MTESSIQEQLEAQKKTTQKALKSKEAAIKYLISIGVIDAAPKSKNQIKPKK